MNGFIIFGIVVLSIIAYGCTGYLIAKIAGKIHKNEDTESVLSCLFYPISHNFDNLVYRVEVKREAEEPFQLFLGQTQDDTPKKYSYPDDKFDGYGNLTEGYVMLMIFFWSFIAIFNIACIIVFLVPTLLKAKPKKQVTLLEEATMLTEQRAEIDRRLEVIRGQMEAKQSDAAATLAQTEALKRLMEI